MSDMQSLVKCFHESVGGLINEKPTLVSDEILELRRKLLQEEVDEFAEAIEDRDLVAMADALGDILYIVFGSGVSLGIDLMPVFLEVHRSNMTKIESDGKVKRREDGKILKPSTYEPPNLEKVLNELRR